jgi:O-antigen/teichoic acid export membrane protein
MKSRKVSDLIPDLMKSLFSRGGERSVKARRQIILSLVIKGLGILVGLTVVPITIHYINPTRYGIWLTLASIMGWFGYFDIGLGNGLRNRFAEALAKGQHELARIYVSTTYAILTIFIGTILILFLCINPFFNWARILNAPPDLAGELFLLATVVFIFFCIQFVLQLIVSIYNASQQPAKAAAIQFFGNLLALITILILTKSTEGNLLYLGTAITASPVIVFLVSSLWVFRTEFRQYAPSLRFVRFSYAHSLLNLGIQFFIIQVSGIVVFTTSNLIIAQMMGPAAVTPYNIAYQYFSLITIVFSIILTPYWSAITEAFHKGEMEWIRTSVKSLVLVWMVFIVLTVIMIFAGGFVYRIWVGKGIHIPFTVTLMLGIYVTFWNWNNIFSYFLNGTGKIRLQLFYYILIGIINIPMAVFLGKITGIPGVILSMIICLTFGAILMPMQYYKVISGKANSIWNK